MPKLLTFAELRDAGVPFVTRSHIRRLELRGEFPKRVQITEHRVGWVKEEIEAWVQAKIDARSGPPEPPSRRGRKRS